MNSCQADTSPHQKGSRDDSLNQYLEQEALSTRMSRIGHTILILSGKGGVGKSTVATNLAVELAASGKVVGLLDVDIHGPSIPKLLGLEGRSPVSTEQGILPIEYDKRLKVMSIAFLLPDRDNAVIWRGPLKMNMIKQFLKDVEWGDPDGAIIVTTPQNLAIVDVRKCVCFCQQLAVPVLGVIENMSRFICPHCGEAVDIFKSGGGEAMASDMHIPFLGRIPIDPDIVQASDCGEPYIRSQAQSAAAAAFRDAIVPVLQMTRRS